MTRDPMSPFVKLRRRAVGRTINIALHGLSFSMRLHPAAPLQRHGVEVLRNLRYGPMGRAHTLDLYRPQLAEKPLPVVLYLHGGGFRILSKDTHWMMGLAFARAGYLVVNANYRLAPRHPFPSALEDAALCLEWVWDNIAAHGGDPRRVIVAGESAGGNLATALSIACSFERPEPFARRLFARDQVPEATVPLCGMLEVSNAARYLEDEDLPLWVRDRVYQVCSDYLADAASSSLDERSLADPVRFLETDAVPVRPLSPFYASCGERDPILDDTRRLEKALVARQVKHRVSYYRGKGHAFQTMVFTSSAEDAQRDCLSFLSTIGG